MLSDARESRKTYESAALPLSYVGAVRRSAPPQTHDRRRTVVSGRVVDSEGYAVMRGDGVNGIVRTPAGRLRQRRGGERRLVVEREKYGPARRVIAPSLEKTARLRQGHAVELPSHPAPPR